MENTNPEEDSLVREAEPLNRSLGNEEILGEPFQLLFYDENKKLVLDLPQLEQLFHQVAILNALGAARTGKGYLLSLFIDFVNWYTLGSNGPWPNPNNKLKHFHWTSDRRQNTRGIYMWNKPFILNRKNGEEFALLLMDTEGAFDVSGSEHEIPIIFALSTLFSSLQLFNLEKNIKTVDLDRIIFVIQFVRRIGVTNSNICQELRFLIRDWGNSNTYAYGGGLHGGQIQEYSKQDRTYDELNSAFETLSCYLLPHPGLAVAENNDMEHTIGEMQIRQEFLEHIRPLFHEVLTQIPLKKVNGSETTGPDLFSMMQHVFEATKSSIGGFSLKDIHARTLIYHACDEAKTTFNNEMRRFNELYPNCREEHLLQMHFQRSQEKAMEIFNDSPRPRDDVFIQRLRNELLQNFRGVLLLYKNEVENRQKARRAFELLGLLGVSTGALIALLIVGD